MKPMEHIKPGDRVRVADLSTDYIATVKRITKTQVILANGTRYRRRDGIEIGRDTWSAGYIDDITEDDILRITYRNAATKAARALSTRNLGPNAEPTSKAYKDLLLDARNIIDAALKKDGEA